MRLVLLTALWACCIASSNVIADDSLTLEAAPAVVIQTIPVAGDGAVSPDVKEIRVVFSKDMKDGSWSWSTVTKDSFPALAGKPRYTDKRTCVLPVKLQPETTYGIWLNSSKFGEFRDAEGTSAIPYLLVFRTTK
ncbi:Ig-like domain-containing protein [Allorhodopirellula heiligendammensis]|uniref:SbsA Ig-like domain-containing protein n=1 Tax=Allorhodopirellula heiligendammensis TaxID=2714739 RepID=A0A5C6BEN7_9BACT|nr:Ig-like domain-containing protein [Allorhodopirellula heiligendammensis]TWU10583.1 hypothetical protein Poly21_44880 [Allorhodopirellula heiligendammensis]